MNYTFLRILPYLLAMLVLFFLEPRGVLPILGVIFVLLVIIYLLAKWEEYIDNLEMKGGKNGKRKN